MTTRTDGSPVGARAEPGSNVVELRRRAAGPGISERPASSELIIDLQAQIDSLRSLKSDLEAWFWEHPADTETERSERYQVTYWIRQLADRTIALEGILMHKGMARLLLRGLAPAEQEALRAASAVLDQWIHEETAFASMLRTVTAVLAAADRIGLRAAGGIPAPEPDTRGPR